MKEKQKGIIYLDFEFFYKFLKKLACSFLGIIHIHIYIYVTSKVLLKSLPRPDIVLHSIFIIIIAVSVIIADANKCGMKNIFFCSYLMKLRNVKVRVSSAAMVPLVVHYLKFIFSRFIISYI